MRVPIRRISRNEVKRIPKPRSGGGRQVSAPKPPIKETIITKDNIIETKPVTDEEDKTFFKKTIENKNHNIKPITDFIEYECYPLVEESFSSIEEIQAAEEAEAEKEVMLAEYYVVIDFEATCEKNNRMPTNNREIIEFAAVLLNKRTLLIEDEFTMFVKPVVNPKLTEYCMELTSISQDDIDEAFSFGTVLAQFKRWLDRSEGKKTFCSWGTYDKKQLLLDCERHNVKYPFNKDHVDIRKLFSTIKGYKRKYSLSSALKRFKMEFQGTKHRGIDDARNIAYVYARLLEQEVK